MALLVDVFRNDNSELKRRQLPLIIDENLSMVMDLNNLELICDHLKVRGKELEEFMRKLRILSSNEISEALKVTCKDLLSMLSETVPCVGCRRSVERVFFQLSKSGHPALDPLTIHPDGILSVEESRLKVPQALCALLHRHSDNLSALVESQLRSKKSRRCALHSLDCQRSRAVVSDAWRDAWERMLPPCKDELLLIESSALHATLNNYLRKHRFCGECRTKVMRAYTLLVEDPEPYKEKGYIPALYSGIKRCLPEKHIHLQCKTDYIEGLITRAEPELLGSRRERHAKTLEIAQEEVLTCLGICVYERLHRIHLRLREEECSCQVLAAVAINALSRNFELAVEQKRGISQLELLYKEITQEEAAKERMREQKRLKKRKKRERKAIADAEVDDCDSDRAASPCTCREPKPTSQQKGLTQKAKNAAAAAAAAAAVAAAAACDCDECEGGGGGGGGGRKRQAGSKKNNKGNRKAESAGISNGGGTGTGNCSSKSLQCDSCEGDSQKKCKPNQRWTEMNLADCGYSSGTGGHNDNVSGTGSSSLPSSPDGSEVACSDGFCNGECTGDGCTDANRPNSTAERKGGRDHRTLEQMLEEFCSSEDEGESYIPLEIVKQFQAQEPNVMKKRQELRETLKNRFAQLLISKH